MSARKHVLAALAPLLTGFHVRADLRPQDSLSRPSVVLVTDQVARAAGGLRREHSLNAFVLVPEGRDLEDRLDEALDQVLETIEAVPALSWQTATRETIGEAHAFRIELKITMAKEQT